MGDRYLVSWDCTGVEYLVNLENIAREQMKHTLAGTPCRSSGPSLQALILRARYNSHRHYEIYAFHVDPDIQEEDVQEWSQRDPQSLVDWVRQNGQKLYSDRLEPGSMKIT